MDQLINRQVLFDSFEGKATSLQRKLIEQWLEDADNRNYYYRCLDEWERSRPQLWIDQQRAQQQYDAFLTGETKRKTRALTDPETEVQKGARIRKVVIGSLAAALALLVLGFVFRAQFLYKTYESSKAHLTSILLSDSTEVTLNSNSILRVPRFGFGRNVRQVWLDGEAEFKVTHTRDNLRFEVLMGDGYRIEVLGTEFNAFSRARGKRVFLTKGKVKLNLPEGKPVYLAPGNYFTTEHKGSFKVVTPAEPLAITAWKEQTFYFEDTRLTEVVEQISERFAVRIRIMDSGLGDRTIGGIYQAKDADALLETLSAMFEMEIIRTSDEIELRIPQKQDL